MICESLTKWRFTEIYLWKKICSTQSPISTKYLKMWIYVKYFILKRLIRRKKN